MRISCALAAHAQARLCTSRAACRLGAPGAGQRRQARRCSSVLSRVCIRLLSSAHLHREAVLVPADELAHNPVRAWACMGAQVCMSLQQSV